MRAFEFSLRQALQWRRTQLELEENKLRQVAGTPEVQALALRRMACEQQVAAQRQKVLEAQRQCRLLEKLEQRRHAEWRREADREMESLAAESFLARWNRQAD